MFGALSRKISGSRIGKQDEQGLSLLHHAAIYNRPQIMGLLLLSAVDVNVRRNNILSTGKRYLCATVSCSNKVIINKLKLLGNVCFGFYISGFYFHRINMIKSIN